MCDAMIQNAFTYSILPIALPCKSGGLTKRHVAYTRSTQTCDTRSFTATSKPGYTTSCVEMYRPRNAHS